MNLSKEQIIEICYSEYESLSNIYNKDTVNAAIVAILSMEDFETKEILVDNLRRTCEKVGNPLRSTTAFEMPNSAELFSLFVECRFKGETPRCPRCGSKHIYLSIPSYKYGRCEQCRYNFSLTSNTMLDNNKMGFRNIVKLLIAIHNDPLISSVALSKTIGITQKTAYFRKVMIDTVIHKIGSSQPNLVLRELLSTRKSHKAYIIDNKHSNAKFRYLSPNQRKEAIQLYEQGKSSQFLAEKYNKDISGIYRLIREHKKTKKQN